jgi:hypothetical protein
MPLTTIKLLLPSFEIIHNYTKDHIIFKCTISDLLYAATIKKLENWKYNRPPDTIRSSEIAESIYNKKQEIDWLIYIVCETDDKNKKDILQIIDGIHRFHSLQIIKRENNKSLDLLTPTLFGSNNNAEWLYEKYIIISLRVNMTTGQSMDLFTQLNNSNPVPELYLVDTDHQKRTTIEFNANDWITKFSTHFTSSKNPNIPNMNRDRFIEILDFVYTKYKLNASTSYVLTEKLYELNTLLKKNHPKKISDNAIEKCIKTGCFIFLLRREQLQDSI